MKYETKSGRQFTGRQLGYMAMHGDAVVRDGELYVDGERVKPIDESDRR